MSLNDIDAALAGGGAKSAFKLTDEPGHRVGGTVVSADLQQARKFDNSGKPTTELRYWDDGKPVMQVVIITQTNERDASDEEDDGRRAHYLKTWGAEKQRFTDAIQQAGYSKASEALIRGNEFYQTLAAVVPGNTAIPRRDYNYQIIRQAADAIDDALTTGNSATQSSPTTSPAAAPAPQPTPAQPIVPAGDDITKKIETVKALIQLGQPDEAIAGVTGLNLAVIAATRNTL